MTFLGYHVSGDNLLLVSGCIYTMSATRNNLWFNVSATLAGIWTQFVNFIFCDISHYTYAVYTQFLKWCVDIITNNFVTYMKWQIPKNEIGTLCMTWTWLHFLPLGFISWHYSELSHNWFWFDRCVFCGFFFGACKYIWRSQF